MAVKTGRLLDEPLRRERNATRRTVLFDEHSTSNDSFLFEVRGEPVVFQLFGAVVGQEVTLYSVLRQQEAIFLLDSVPVKLNASVNTVVFQTAGVYRMKVTSGSHVGLTLTMHPQTADDSPCEVPQASGVQANLPNLFMSPEGATNPTNIWEISDKPWIFTAFGLGPGEFIETYVVYGQNETYKEEIYLLNGVAQVLSPLSTSIILSKAGRYRFKLTGSLLGKTLVGNPTNATASSGESAGGVQSVGAGSGITVDNANPLIPVVSLSAATLASLTLAGSALQSGDDISELVNDAGYLTVAPVTSVNSLVGDVNLTTTNIPEGANLYYTDVRADSRIALQKGVSLGLATLDTGGKLNTSQLPAIAITDTFVVASEAAMLALVAERGDVAVRTDETESYILVQEPASILTNWQLLLHPASPVTSVFGRVGPITAAFGDYTFAQIASTPTTLAGYGITDAALDSAVVHIAGPETITGAKTFTSTIFAGVSDWRIAQNTSDGSDDGRIVIHSGGAASNSRGAYLILYGNEYATTPGEVLLTSGLNANIRLNAAGSGNLILDTGTGEVQSSGDIAVCKSNAVIAVGPSAGNQNGGIANYGGVGVGQIGLYSNIAAGTLFLRPNGRTSTVGQVFITTTQIRADDSFLTLGAQSGGGIGQLRVEDSTSPRISITVTGNRRYSIGGTGTSLTVRDESGSSDRITVAANGDVTLGAGRFGGTALHNHASGLAGTTTQYIGSGTYTPTLTATANIASSSASACQWLRVGNVVTVSGRINVATTAAANTVTQIRISLPLVSGLAGVSQLSGSGGRLSAGGIEVISIASDTTNDEALLTFYSTATPSVGCTFHFTYLIV